MRRGENLRAQEQDLVGVLVDRWIRVIRRPGETCSGKRSAMVAFARENAPSIRKHRAGVAEERGICRRAAKSRPIRRKKTPTGRCQITATVGPRCALWRASLSAGRKCASQPLILGHERPPEVAASRLQAFRIRSGNAGPTPPVWVAGGPRKDVSTGAGD